MMEDEKENRGFDQETSDELEKMSEKTFLSYSEPHEGESKIKINGGSDSGSRSAETLMYMHLYGNYHLRHRLPPRDEPTPDEAASLPVKKRKSNMMNHVGGSSSLPSGKQKEKSEGSDGNEELNGENNMWVVKVISLIKEKKEMKLGTEMIKSEGEPLMIRTSKQQEVKPSKSYVCNVCNKSFPCFQALGGHKTKHNRKKNIAKSTKGKEVVEQRQEEEENKVGINGASLISSEERFVISSKNHENNSNKEEVGEASQQSGSKIRGFNLNVPYVLEDEETDI
ncbi:hypothetical protein K1719_014422 [Acacia pycnantha]|nr:hypothetical protein K1719_014422 [Acacia pycnantha]